MSTKDAGTSRLEENIREARAEFDSFDDPALRYSFLTELSAYVPRPAEGLVCDSYRYQGCVSPTWLDVSFEGGFLTMRYWSETLLVRSVLYVIESLYEGVDAQEAAKVEVDLDEVFGVEGFLSERRRRGMAGVLALIQSKAAEAVLEGVDESVSDVDEAALDIDETKLC